MSRSVYTLLALAAMGLGGAVALTARPPTAAEQIFIDHSILHVNAIKKLLPGVQEQVKELQAQLSQMEEMYDEIITIGPVPERRGLVNLYEAERPRATANKINLDASARELEPTAKAAGAFLEKNKQLSYLPAFRTLNNWTLDAELAVKRAVMLSSPDPLPDPLPSAAVPSLEIVDRAYEKETVVGEQNRFLVTIQSNRRFTVVKKRVEARVMFGPAKLDDPPVKSVEIGGQKSLTVPWRFTVTDTDDFSIAARILR